MKAIVIHEFGDINLLKYEEIETPKPKPGNVLIKVLAAGVNRFDHYIREGSVIKDISFPHILGSDAVGEIAEIGDGVSGFNVGERVIPLPAYPTNKDDYDIYPMSAAPSFSLSGMGFWGSYAQYIEVPARWVIKDETNLNPEELATLPMVLTTAVRAVKSVGGVKVGDKVLVQAGASGTGSMQILVAKALGAKVATTLREEEKTDFVKKLGVDLIINTRKEDFVERVQQWTDGNGADVVIDNLGGTVLPKSIDAAKTLGVIVAMGFVTGTEVTFDIRNFFFAQKQLRGSMFGDIKDFKWGLEQVKDGKIKPLLDHTLPLNQAAEAHRLLVEGKVAGNIVLLPWQE